MKTARSSTRYQCFCFVLVGLMGITSFIWPAEEPEKAVNGFAELFISRNAAGILQIMNPEMVSGKELREADIENFLKRIRSKSMRLKRATVDKRLKAEDGSAERFQSTLVFEGPPLGSHYVGPSTLKIRLLWVLSKRRWLLERPLSIDCFVTSNQVYPTGGQEDVALRFEATVGVLERLGLVGNEDLPFIGPKSPGSLMEDFKELERIHPKEKGASGMHRTASGVEVLIKAANRSQGGILRIYHGDFKRGPKDKRRPVPWEVFRDYTDAAMDQAKSLEKAGNVRGAERIYKSIIALGREFLNEPGGLQFLTWGITFQKRGAEGLFKLLPANAQEERKRIAELVSLCSRKLDLLQTALGCLDDLADYKALKAAILAANKPKDVVFRPWGINTLSILAAKGAPADREVIKIAGGMVYVLDPNMQKVAGQALDELASKGSEAVKAFIAQQKQWVSTHRVYGAAAQFK